MGYVVVVLLATVAAVLFLDGALVGGGIATLAALGTLAYAVVNSGRTG